nr:PREDICTED: protein amnionless [Struthio camelus australis]
MKSLFFLLLFLQLLAAAVAVYKQWLPNTNFETASNWDKDRVPCASDVIHFEREKRVVLVRLNGKENGSRELPVALLRARQRVRAARAAQAQGRRYKRVRLHGRAAAGCFRCPPLDFEQSRRQRSVGFSAFGTELWMLARGRPSSEAPAEYLPLNGELILASGAGFAAFDSSWDPGCDSGSAARFRDADGFAWFDPALWQTTSSLGELQQGARIFAVDEERVPCQYDDVIFQPETSFRVNVDSSRGMIHLRSISLMGQVTWGGAIVCLEFTPDFDLQKYQDRLVQAFLSLPKYAGVQMAISKVHKPQTFLGITLRSSTPVIQIVLIDDRNGSQTGTAAEQLAADIMGDIAQHGEALGISRGKMEVASGSIFSGQAGISTSSKILTGTVLGLLFSLLLLGAALFLYRKGTPRLWAVRLPRPWGGAQGPASPEPATDKGFDNPMFDVPLDTAARFSINATFMVTM